MCTNITNTKKLTLTLNPNPMPNCKLINLQFMLAPQIVQQG